MNKKPKWLEFLEFIPVRIIFSLTQLLPQAWSLSIGKGLGMLLYYAIPPLRKITLNGLYQAFRTTKTHQEIVTIAKYCYQHFGKVFIEFMQLPRFYRQKSIQDKVDFGQSLAVLDRLLERGKGVIALAMHYGNWEVMTAATSDLGRPIHVIVRILDNRILDRYVENIRQIFGTRVIDKRLALREGIKTLKAGRVLAFLVDQNTAFNMVFVPFFNRLAATARGAMVFARRFPDTPVMAAWSWRDEKNKLHIMFEELPVDHTIQDPEEFDRIHMAGYTKYFENIISQRPEQWLWWHERWKSYPAEQKNYAELKEKLAQWYPELEESYEMEH